MAASLPKPKLRPCKQLTRLLLLHALQLNRLLMLLMLYALQRNKQTITHLNNGTKLNYGTKRPMGEELVAY